MFCVDIPAPLYLIFSDSVPKLLYYSHVPTAIIALLFGFFVFFKNRTLVSKILLAIAIIFSLWLFSSLIVWTNIDSSLIMFAWSLFGILYALIYVLSLYLVYVFIEKKDLFLKGKLLLILLLMPIIFFAPSVINLEQFDLIDCEAKEGIYYTFFYYSVGLLILFWIVSFAISRYRREIERDSRKQIILFTVGIELFLLSFFLSGFLASYLVEKGIIRDFGIEQYGLFGMTVFIGFLAYLIVKFNAFHIKLLGAQALVITLIILIGSELFFAESGTNKILILITLALSLGFGYMLVRSVKLEVERKEELQVLSDKLARANDQLRKLDNTKSEFISIASHQLRTPLTAIKGFVSLLMEGSYGRIEPRIRDVLHKVYQSNERLIQLVEDLLNISRIESGRMEYRWKLEQVEEIITQLEDTFILRAKEKGLDLTIRMPEKPLPKVEMDISKIREVISNLIDNALKYTERGGVTVSAKSKGKDVVQIIVADTGIGIPKETLPYLFSKFSRGKDITRLHAEGVGLGLFVGKNLIEAHHGKIIVDSPGAGQGSHFIIELPLRQPPKLLLETAAQKEKTPLQQ